MDAGVATARRGIEADGRGGRLVIRPRGPFDLALSLEAAQSFLPITGSAPSSLGTAIEIGGERAIVAISQCPARSGLLCASSVPALPPRRLRTLVRWLVCHDLDLRPFYSSMAEHPVMNAVVCSLPGLKPLRPATLFEMAVIAITEQQLSLAAAFHIRDRLVARHGAPLGNARVFPTPAVLAHAPTETLLASGLSRRKAEYLQALATSVDTEGLDFETLRGESDERIRQVLRRNRGLGEWSIEYILVRGFGRPDSLPPGDTGLQRVVGRYLAGKARLTATELQQVLAPFKPYRGLAAYYLAVHWRLRNAGSKRPSGAGTGASNVAHAKAGGADLP